MNEKTERRKFLEIMFNWWTLISALVIPFAIVLTSVDIREDTFVETLKTNTQAVVITYFVTLILLSIPQYFIKRFSSLKDEIDKKLAKIDNCPKMTALHTEEKAFEQKIRLLEELNTPNQ